MRILVQGIWISNRRSTAVREINAFSTAPLQISANPAYVVRSDPGMQASVASQPHLYNASPTHRAPP